MFKGISYGAIAATYLLAQAAGHPSWTAVALSAFYLVLAICELRHCRLARRFRRASRRQRQPAKAESGAC